MTVAIRYRVLLAVALLATRKAVCQAGRSGARGAIDGVVVDSSLTPIAGATISLIGTTIGATTGANGRFRIVALPVGEYVVMARRLGYERASAMLHIDDADTLRLSLSLHRVTPQLDTVYASALFATTRLGEFEERRAHSIGHFITADEIEKRNPASIADVLRSVLSVGIVDTGFRRVAYSLRGKCPFRIFVDGQIFSEIGDLTAAPSPKEIAAVEIYSGAATIPLQYKRYGTACGVVLIWTK
jgi:hypothetical protein